jgi:RNA polymerase sigma-70 factor (ECF subfamily)
MTVENEPELVREARGGSLEAFAQLVRLHQRAVLACLAVRMNDPNDVEDLAQEVFIVAHGKLAEFDPARPFGPWLRGIAHHLLQNHRRKYRPAAVGHDAELQAVADEGIERVHASGGEEGLLGAMERCLEKLDSESRDLLRLRYGEALPLGDVGARLGKKHSAVTMWLHRVRLGLRDCIERRMAESNP